MPKSWLFSELACLGTILAGVGPMWVTRPVEIEVTNACVKSFFGSLKNECLKGKMFETYEQGEKDVFKYIGLFYNRKRRHAPLGYVSPAVC